MKKLWPIGLLLVAVAATQCLLIRSSEHFPPRSLYHVGSKIEDKQAPGGFGPSNNLPRTCNDNSVGEGGKLSLIAYPDQTVSHGKRTGMLLRLVNRSTTTATFEACDSLLFLVQEAQDENGHWVPVETYPDSWCGNSFHRVFLEANEYWELLAPRYPGSFKTKIRFRLEPMGEKAIAAGGQPLYSNEFDGSINPGQFVRKKTAS